MLKKFLGIQNSFFHLRAVHLCNRKFSNQGEQPDRETFNKSYLKNLKQNLTDFQNEFGFDESLKEIHLENLKIEKRVSRSYQVLIFLIASTVIGSVVIALSREGSRETKKFVYTHSTNILLSYNVGSNLLSGGKSSAIKLSLIKTYLANMKEADLKNTRYAGILLEEIDFILKNLLILSQGYILTNHKDKIPIDSFEEALSLTCELFQLIDEKNNQETYMRISNLLINQVVGVVDSSPLTYFFKFEDFNLRPEAYTNIINIMNIVLPYIEEPLSILETIKSLNKLIENQKIDINSLSLTRLSKLNEKIYENIKDVDNLKYKSLSTNSFAEFQNDYDANINRGVTIETLLLQEKLKSSSQESVFQSKQLFQNISRRHFK